MGMFYCHGCDRHHDSKDGEYNVTTDGKEYCDDTLPEDAQVECNNPAWHEIFGGANLPAPLSPMRISTKREDEAFISHAVNSYDDMAEALGQIRRDQSVMSPGSKSWSIANNILSRINHVEIPHA